MKKAPRKRRIKDGIALTSISHPVQKKPLITWSFWRGFRSSTEDADIEIDSPLFVGYAVRIGHRTECWAYNPDMLTKKQLKLLGVLGWKKIQTYVGVDDRG